MITIYFANIESFNKDETPHYYTYPCIVLGVSIMLNGISNLISDKKLERAADFVNHKPVEKFVSTKKIKRFQLSTWD